MQRCMRFGCSPTFSLGKLIAVICLPLLLGLNLARGGSITYGAAGTDSDSETLAATAEFTTGSGTLSIVLTNLIGGNDVRSAGQALSDIQFTLSATPTNNATGASASGQLIDIGSGGRVTTLSGNPDRWIGSGHITTSGDTITIEVLGGGKPGEMILGSGPYGNANSSITSNFSPYVEGSLTLTLNVPGITSDTTVTNATFSFGTGPDTYLPGSTIPFQPFVAVPAPQSVVLLGLGGIGMVVVLARSRRRLAVA